MEFPWKLCSEEVLKFWKMEGISARLSSQERLSHEERLPWRWVLKTNLKFRNKKWRWWSAWQLIFWRSRWWRKKKYMYKFALNSLLYREDLLRALWRVFKEIRETFYTKKKKLRRAFNVQNGTEESTVYRRLLKGLPEERSISRKSRKCFRKVSVWARPQRKGSLSEKLSMQRKTSKTLQCTEQLWGVYCV